MAVWSRWNWQREAKHYRFCPMLNMTQETEEDAAMLLYNYDVECDKESERERERERRGGWEVVQHYRLVWCWLWHRDCTEANANSKHWFTTYFLWRKVPESDARSVRQTLPCYMMTNATKRVRERGMGGGRERGVGGGALGGCPILPFSCNAEYDTKTEANAAMVYDVECRMRQREWERERGGERGGKEGGAGRLSNTTVACDAEYDTETEANAAIPRYIMSNEWMNDFFLYSA